LTLAPGLFAHGVKVQGTFKAFIATFNEIGDGMIMPYKIFREYQFSSQQKNSSKDVLHSIK